MAADANLIKGAREAARGASKSAMAGGAALGAAAQGIIGRIDAQTLDVKKKTDEAKERKRASDEKFYDNQEAALLQGGALGTAEFDLTEKKVKGFKKEYDRCALGDDACQRKVMMQLSQESQSLTAMKDTRALNAEAMSTLRGDVSTMDKEIMGIFSNSQSGDYTIDEDPAGEKTYTFTMADGSTEVRKGADVQKLFEMQQDAVGAEKTSAMALEQIENGKNGLPFDAFKVGASFDTLLKDDNSLFSALHDDWGVGNFSASIDKKVETEVKGLNGKIDFAMNMRDKGIDLPAEEGEANWYDNVTDEDIALIKNRLMNPESDEEKEISRNVAKEYYVDAMEQQNQRGVKQAQDASDAAQRKIDEKNNFEILKGGIKSKIQAENNAAKIGILQEKEIIDNNKVSTKVNVKSGTQTMPNVDPNKATDGTENTITYDVAYAKDLGNKIEDKSFTGGFAGQQMNRYYYKTNDGNFRQFESKEDFIKENDLNAAIKAAGETEVDGNGRIIYNEEQEQIIANFKAASGGINGGNPISMSTLRTEEGIDSAQNEVVEETTENAYLDNIQNQRMSVRKRQIIEANKNKTTGGGVAR